MIITRHGVRCGARAITQSDSESGIGASAASSRVLSAGWLAAALKKRPLQSVRSASQSATFWSGSSTIAGMPISWSFPTVRIDRRRNASSCEVLKPL